MSLLGFLQGPGTNLFIKKPYILYCYGKVMSGSTHNLQVPRVRQVRVSFTCWKNPDLHITTVVQYITVHYVAQEQCSSTACWRSHFCGLLLVQRTLRNTRGALVFHRYLYASHQTKGYGYSWRRFIRGRWYRWVASSCLMELELPKVSALPLTVMKCWHWIFLPSFHKC